MLIRVAKKSDVRSHEITPKSVYLNRREMIAATGLIAGSALLPKSADAALVPAPGVNKALTGVTEGYRKLGANDGLTKYEAASTYNNFYEFGTGKEDPAEKAGKFKPLPWTIKVDGLCNQGGTFSYEDFVKPHQMEERIYRFRCVEGWSMVIPWIGISLADIIKRAEPQASAKYVEFETIVRPEEMPGQKSRFILPWPYVEGLRMDEAMNPLAIMAVGMYGEMLPNQNGAPLRLMAPWKYGFKNIKSIVRINFVEKEPKNTWQVVTPNEYGFYANVNPKVDHPRWSQASERRIGDFLKRETLMFNGYEEEVASMYAGMNLAKYY
jgi:methionine sulfoxide reductase catalytic subunit